MRRGAARHNCLNSRQGAYGVVDAEAGLRAPLGTCRPLIILADIASRIAPIMGSC